MKISIIKNQEELRKQLQKINERSSFKLEQVNETVSSIIADVKKRKDAALIYYAAQFDGAALTSLRVSDQEIEEAYHACDKHFLSILEEARNNIIEYHSLQHYADIQIDTCGRQLSQKITPIKRVGIYVPGGKSPYPSTVLMDSIPAQVAGVKEIAMITPSDKDGKVGIYWQQPKSAGLRKYINPAAHRRLLHLRTERKQSSLYIKSAVPGTYT